MNNFGTFYLANHQGACRLLTETDGLPGIMHNTCANSKVSEWYGHSGCSSWYAFENTSFYADGKSFWVKPRSTNFHPEYKRLQGKVQFFLYHPEKVDAKEAIEYFPTGEDSAKYGQLCDW